MINFDNIPKTIMPQFKGGKGDTIANIFTEEKMKILNVLLKPGCSIGLHTHDEGCEVIYIVKGTATCTLNGQEDIIHEGECHYCPNKSEHSMANNENEDLIAFCVVPK